MKAAKRQTLQQPQMMAELAESRYAATASERSKGVCRTRVDILTCPYQVANCFLGRPGVLERNKAFGL
jgi:hypothetical protein